jgi:hypothetical protein
MAENGDKLDPPATDEERALAAELSRALEESEDAPAGDEAGLVAALRAAWDPAALDEDEHAALVERVLERTMGSRRELQEAAELRRALEDEGAPSEEADLARSLRSAWSPRPIEPRAHAEIVERVTRPAPRRGVVIRVVFGGGAALALAAAVLLVIGQVGKSSAPIATSPAVKLSPSRSTQELFDKPFERGAASARIDRIALSRAGDLRDNRFAMWGVR